MTHRRCVVLKLAIVGSAIIAFNFLIKALVLHGQTGAYTLQPYDWYSAENQVVRSFPQEVPVSITDATERCVKKDSQSAALPSNHRHHQQLSLQEQSVPTNDATIHPISGLRRVLVYVHNVDIFPWLWESLLDSGTLEEQGQIGAYTSQMLREPGKHVPLKHKVIAEEKIEFVLVDGDPTLAMQNNGVMDIIVVAWEMPTMLWQSLPSDAHVGLVVASLESCNNPPLDSRVKFSLLTYGDCAIVDHERNKIWPLGPRTSDGFPPKYNNTLPSSQRKYTLNLAATYNTAKPTRMQAWIKATEACEFRTCAITWTNPATRILEVFDKLLGTRLTDWTRESDSRAYISLLSNSKFTLCPAGKNPEQYRIYEAIMAGSIPIIEDHYIPPGAIHPAYKSKWRCTDAERHYWLKKTNAPVLFVDWRELPSLLDKMDDASIERRQADLISWFAKFRAEMRDMFLHQVREYL